MGVSILFIMLFHSRTLTNLDYTSIPILNFISQISYGGVDIFLFLSGFGLYYSSLKKESTLQYYQNRFIRIYPAYIVALFLNNLLLKDYSIINYLKELFALDIWTGNTVPFWYVSGIIFLYLIFPFYIKLFKRKPYLATFGAISISLTATIIFLKSGIDRWFIILFLTRIPIFFIGILFGKLSLDNKMNTSKLKVGLYILTFIGFILLYIFLNDSFLSRYLWKGLLWYPFMFITPGFALLLSAMFEKYIKENNIRCVFLFFGKISFELYLIHTIFFIFIDSISAIHNINLWLMTLIMAIVSIICAYILHLGTNKIIFLVKKKL